MKPSRKNHLKKHNQARRARWRVRIVFVGKAVVGALVLVTASCAFIFAYDYFTQSRHFQAREIAVSGQQRLSRQEILTMAGIGPLTNILSVNLTTTRKRLLAEPWIADVSVSREIPSGLRIHIREEKALARLEMDDGRGFLINLSGQAFKRDDGPEGGRLPRVQGLSDADLPVAGQPATAAFKSVMTLLRLAREKNSPPALADIRRLRIDRDIGITLYIGEDERAVKLGFGHYREKAVALGRLMRRLSEDSELTRYRIIDLFDVNRIVITPAALGGSGSDLEEVKVAGG